MCWNIGRLQDSLYLIGTTTNSCLVGKSRVHRTLPPMLERMRTSILQPLYYRIWRDFHSFLSGIPDFSRWWADKQKLCHQKIWNQTSFSNNITYQALYLKALRPALWWVPEYTKSYTILSINLLSNEHLCLHSQAIFAKSKKQKDFVLQKIGSSMHIWT